MERERKFGDKRYRKVETFDNPSFLKDEPTSELDKMVKEEFRKMPDLVSENDILIVKDKPKFPYNNIEYYSARFSDEKARRRNYEPSIDLFLNRTQVLLKLGIKGKSMINYWCEEEVDNPIYTACLISKLGVNPAYQGNGVGRMLYEVTEAICNRLDIVTIKLNPKVTNTGFWEKIGFEDVPDEIPTVGDKIHEITVWEKQL